MMRRKFIQSSELLITAATSASCAFTTTCTFTGFENVLRIRRGHRISIQRHDWIRQAITLVRLDPWFDAAATTKAGQQQQWQQDLTTSFDIHVHNINFARGMRPKP